jgi:hypothetical protein
MNKKSIRAAQLVTPFGPGAIVELGGESFACTDTTRWPAGDCPTLPENPLQSVLGKAIRRPPMEESAAEVPFYRFPRWLFCPSCRRLYDYRSRVDEDNGFGTPACDQPQCKKARLVPMRFVAVCEHGHLQDVDWFRWAHRNTQVSENGQCTRQTARLKFLTTGASGGDFNAMSIRCESCNVSNTFEGLTNRPYPFKCHGRQPWERYRETGCEAVPRVFPRAASNVYYAQTRSALDIRDGGSEQVGRREALLQWLNQYPTLQGFRSMAKLMQDWEDKKEIYQPIVEEAVRQFGLAEDATRDAVVEAIKGKGEGQKANEGAGTGDRTQHGILMSEWPVLSGKRGVRSAFLKTRPFMAKDVWPAPYCRPVEQITLVDRLREVRALVGFRRMKPDSSATEVEVDLGQGLDWLPGIEAFGEGIFLKLSESHVSAWEGRVQPLLAERTSKLREACMRWGRDPAEVYASPRFIALHTLAHGLLRRLAFDAGYSSTSIRERIFCSGGARTAAGILLYTSEGDSEGSLGGLVRQGDPARFLGTLKRALADLSWCSADPVCGEMEYQGVDGMNAAACHACALVGETSCVFNNGLLDRRLVVGSLDGKVPGLLGELASEASYS